MRAESQSLNQRFQTIEVQSSSEHEFTYHASSTSHRWYQALPSDEGEAESANPAKQLHEPASQSKHCLDTKCQNLCCRCCNSTNSQKPRDSSASLKYHPSPRHHLKHREHGVKSIVALCPLNPVNRMFLRLTTVSRHHVPSSSSKKALNAENIPAKIDLVAIYGHVDPSLNSVFYNLTSDEGHLARKSMRCRENVYANVISDGTTELDVLTVMVPAEASKDDVRHLYAWLAQAHIIRNSYCASNLRNKSVITN